MKKRGAKDANIAIFSAWKKQRMLPKKMNLISLEQRNEFNFFGTTLSVSPHKNAAWINEILMDLENKILTNGGKTKALLADFKKENGYLRSLKLSKEFGLYRQDYCGCRPNLSENN